jgi:cell division protein FtsB
MSETLAPDDPAQLLIRANQEVQDRAFAALMEQQATIARQAAEIAALKARCEELEAELEGWKFP